MNKHSNIANTLLLLVFSIGIVFLFDLPLYTVATLILIGIVFIIVYPPNLKENLNGNEHTLDTYIKTLMNHLIDENGDINLKNVENKLGKNKAIAVLYSNNELVEKYIAVSGKQLKGRTKNFSKKNVHFTVLPLSENSPFIISERLSSDLNWIKMSGLNSNKQEDKLTTSFIYNQSNNCTERKVIDAI